VSTLANTLPKMDERVEKLLRRLVAHLWPKKHLAGPVDGAAENLLDSLGDRDFVNISEPECQRALVKTL